MILLARIILLIILVVLVSKTVLIIQEKYFTHPKNIPLACTTFLVYT